MRSVPEFRETADTETSSDDYASRFSGPVGAWFLKTQEDATLRMLSPHAGATVLEVGGGHGQLTGALIRQGYQVTVLASAEECKARITNFIDEGLCTFTVGNILALPYPDRAFDVVISFRLLAHVTRWPQLLKELTRVADKVVLVDYPATRSFNWMASRLFVFKRSFEGNTRPFTCFKEAQLVEIFEARGFAPVDRYSQFLLPMVFHRILGRAGISSRTEALFRLLGMTSRLGSPVILKSVRQFSSHG